MHKHTFLIGEPILMEKFYLVLPILSRLAAKEKDTILGMHLIKKKKGKINNGRKITHPWNRQKAP